MTPAVAIAFVLGMTVPFLGPLAVLVLATVRDAIHHHKEKP